MPSHLVHKLSIIKDILYFDTTHYQQRHDSGLTTCSRKPLNLCKCVHHGSDPLPMPASQLSLHPDSI